MTQAEPNPQVEAFLNELKKKGIKHIKDLQQKGELPIRRGKRDLPIMISFKYSDDYANPRVFASAYLGYHASDEYEGWEYRYQYHADIPEELSKEAVNAKIKADHVGCFVPLSLLILISLIVIL